MFAKSALENGIGIIGGCCGTDKSYIAAMKEVIDSGKFKSPVFDKTVDIVATTEKEAFFIHSEFDKSNILKCSDNLPEDILEIEESGCDVITVEINTAEDVETFFTYSYMFSLPVFVICENQDILSVVARQFCGRLMTNKSEIIDEKLLNDLIKKYGLIVI